MQVNCCFHYFVTDKIGSLKRLGFRSLPECSLVAPQEYRDYLEPLQILPIPDTGIKHYLAMTLVEKAGYDSAGQLTTNWKKTFRLNLRVVDGRGDGIAVTIFGNVWPWLDAKLGDELHMYGEVTTWNNKRQINNPDVVMPAERGRVVPLYKGKPGQVSAESVTLGVQAAMEHLDEAACILLVQAGLRESEFTAMTGLKDPVDLIKTLHQPLSVREGEAAVAIAKQLSITAMLNRAARTQAHIPVEGSSIPVNRTVVAELIQKLPFPATGDQRKAIDEIVSDLRSPFPMRRLLSGDVGTGKSVTFMVPAVAAFLAGALVAIIVPNQLLVPQIAGEIRQYFPGIPVCEVVSGGKIGEGIIVGTTAVLTAAKKINMVFGFVITDEQHKFSVDQKEGLLAPHANLLEATATAIPRTLALVQFGGIALSVLRECPVRKEIKTRIVMRQDGSKLFEFVTQQIQKGGQVAIIYPLAEDKGDGDRNSVEAAFQRFDAMWPGRVAMLHGKLPDDDKLKVIEQMKGRERDAVVSSTVIEVGLTLPSLRVVVVVNAERFGASQLHQLRGRVARGGGVGFFFMYQPEEIEDASLERLKLLVECSDGFSLAERDADLRGFGDIDAAGGTQTGASRILFWGVRLSRNDIEEAASL